MNLHFTREWMERAAELEGDHEIGAGFEICDAPPGFIRDYFNATNQGDAAMTTKVTVEANHGWPVKVTGVKVGTMEDANYGGVVPKNEKRDFHCHSGMDLIVHEIQPSETEADAAPAA